MSLAPAHEAYWRAYVDRLPTGSRVGRVVADYAGDPSVTDRLIDLYLSGRKIAGSGLVEDYLASGDPLPEIGDHWIALGADGTPRCILRTLEVETHAFLKVPERIAVAEGEGDLTLEYWRRAHAAHFAPHLREWGLGAVEDATVVTEFFEIVHR